MFPEYVNQMSTMLMTGEEELPEEDPEDYDDYSGQDD